MFGYSHRVTSEWAICRKYKFFLGGHSLSDRWVRYVHHCSDEDYSSTEESSEVGSDLNWCEVHRFTPMLCVVNYFRQREEKKN